MSPAADRCAEAARSAAVDPIGTAGVYDGFVLVEWPLPWPANAGDVVELADLVALLESESARGRRLRLQLVLGDQRPTIERRMILYRRGGQTFSGFSRHEHSGVPRELADLCASLLEGPAEPASPATATVADVLVCGHGSRDVCCGSRGAQLHAEVAGRLPAGINLWRTSHTGGHRFAPTAITLPDGQYWAYLDASTLVGIVAREPDMSRLERHHRGSSGAEGFAAQAVDRKLLLAHGWPWLGWRREFEEETVDGERRRVRVWAERPDGHRTTYQAEVSLGRLVELPRCREPGEVATVDHQPEVLSLVSDAPGPFFAEEAR